MFTFNTSFQEPSQTNMSFLSPHEAFNERANFLILLYGVVSLLCPFLGALLQTGKEEEMVSVILSYFPFS